MDNISPEGKERQASGTSRPENQKKRVGKPLSPSRQGNDADTPPITTGTHLISIDGMSDAEKTEIVAKTEDDSLDDSALRYKYSPRSAAQLKDLPVPEQLFVVQDYLPRGKVITFAAAGGIGKGIMMLDLAYQVTRSKTGKESWMGHTISPDARTAVMIVAEDSLDDIHARLAHVLQVREYPETLFIITLPDIGITDPFFTVKSGGAVQRTRAFFTISDILVGIKPDLVIIDPLSCFAEVDLDKSNHQAAHVMKAFASMAKTLDACIVVVHHVSKAGQVSSSARDTDDEMLSVANVRASVRGATSIIDESRGAFVAWIADKNTRELAASIKCEEHPAQDSVLHLQFVKSNFRADKSRHTLWRTRTGRIEDITDVLNRGTLANPESIKDSLVKVISEYAAAGQPFMATGKERGIYDRRDVLPEHMKRIPRDPMHQIVNELIAEGRLVKCPLGSGQKSYLDRPGGKLANGCVTKYAPGYINLYASENIRTEDECDDDN